jgi:hypothetical protein
MRLVNKLCRYVEIATEQAPAVVAAASSPAAREEALTLGL